MTCILLKDDDFVVVEGTPSVFISNEDFDLILRDSQARHLLFKGLLKMDLVEDGKVLVGQLGVKEEDVYRDYKVCRVMPANTHFRKGLGVYEKLY